MVYTPGMFCDLPSDERAAYLQAMLAEPDKLPAFAARLQFECDDTSAAHTRDDVMTVFETLCDKAMEFPVGMVREAWLATYKPESCAPADAPANMPATPAPKPGNMPDVDERTRIFLEPQLRDDGRLALFLVLLRIEPTRVGADRIAGVLRMCQAHNVSQTAFRAAVTSFCNLLRCQDPGAAPRHATACSNLVPFIS